MFSVIVTPEPNDSRPLYRWRLFGSQLLATGIALTEEGARRHANAAAKVNALRSSAHPPGERSIMLPDLAALDG